MREVKIVVAAVLVLTTLGLLSDKVPAFLCFLVYAACVCVLNMREAMEEALKRGRSDGVREPYGLAEPKPKGSQSKPHP